MLAVVSLRKPKVINVNLSDMAPGTRTINKLDIAIVGGGLGGLTAAICLIKSGHNVRVFEQASALTEVGAGIQISANASRVLLSLGLKEKLDAVAIRPEFYRFRLFSTGEILNEIRLASEHIVRYGAPYYHIHRADLLEILVSEFTRLAADSIYLNHNVIGFDESDNHITLKVSEDRAYAANLLIGADGIKSTIRTQLLGDSPVTFANQIAWRATVPVERLPTDFMDLSCTIWCGPRGHMVVYYVRGGELVNFVACVDTDEWVEESWTQKADWEELRADFFGWHDDVLTLIEAVDRDQCFRWALNNRPPNPNWSTNRTTLLGDAIHPTIPYLGQGAAMALEDAAVLCRTLDETTTVTDALQLYQNHRYGRTSRVVHESSANAEMFHLGSEDALRDAFSKRDLGEERGAWLFNYDPLTVPLV